MLHQLLILGEATKRLSAGFRSRVDHLPWREMAGLRDRLIHGYSEVDLDQIWKTLQEDLPRVLEALEPLTPPQE